MQTGWCPLIDSEQHPRRQSTGLDQQPSSESESQARASVVQELRALDFETVFVIFSSLLFFTVFWYFGRIPFYRQALAQAVPPSSFSPAYGFTYFVIASLVLRMLLPMACIVFVLKRSLADFGFCFSTRGLKVYGLLFLAMLPLVFFAGTQSSFIEYYPQCKGLIRNNTITWTHLIVFELTYGLLFVSGESFWRGYMVFGTERTLGYYGVLFMVIPYAMSHYEKPFLETLGAFVAGSVLGVLALRHRSFWLGVAVHWGVAICMDLMAMFRRGVTVAGW